MKKISLLVAAVLCGSSIARAADEPWLADFQKADLNDSGGLSLVELDKSKSSRLQPIKSNFKAIDADNDGHVTADEYRHYLSLTSSNLIAVFKKADLNDSGGLSKVELDKRTEKEFDAIRKNFDAIDANKDGQVTLAEVEQYQKAHAAVTSSVVATKDLCHTDCGVVTMTDRYKVQGEGSPLGAVAGGVVGGLLGNQVGGGTGKTVATVGGAAGGAFAGYQVEKRLKTRKMVKVTVKFDDGHQQDFEYEADKSPFAKGARVQLKDGALTAYTGQ